MTHIQFFAVVCKMRQAQKMFFATPQSHPSKGDWLKESKRLENIIDREIKHVCSISDADELRAAYKPFDPTNTTQQKLSL